MPKKVKILAFIIVALFPAMFYGFFEWKKQQTGFRLNELPVLSVNAMPAFEMLTHDSLLFSHTALQNKIVVANSFFTRCPGICKDLTSQMSRIENYFARNTNFKSDYTLLSFTVDPNTDSPEMLRHYIEKNELKTRNWYFLTGNQDSLYQMIIGFFKLPALPVNSLEEPFAHSEKLVLIDKSGFIRGYYDGTDSAAVNRLMRDAVLLDIHYAIAEGKNAKEAKRKNKKP